MSTRHPALSPDAPLIPPSAPAAKRPRRTRSRAQDDEHARLVREMLAILTEQDA